MARLRSFMPVASYDRWLLYYVLLLYLIICCFLFIAYVDPSLHGNNSLRIGADSSTYLEASKSIDPADGLLRTIPLLIAFQGQTLGPVIIGRMLDTTLNIAIFNSLIFILGLWYVSSLPGVRFGLFTLLLILNPTTTVSILTLNKEILAYISIICFIRYVATPKRNLLALVILLTIALLARWEQCAIIILILTVEHRWSPLKKKHKTVLLMMVGAITLMWPLLVKSGIVDLASLLTVSEDAQSHTLPLLNNIQASYGFPIVLVPKMIGGTFGVSWNPVFLVGLLQSADFSDVQNQIVMPLQNLIMLIIFGMAWFRGKLDLKKQTIYFIWMYLIMSAAAPIYQPRYQYPIYVLLCLEIAGLALPAKPYPLITNQQTCYTSG